MKVSRALTLALMLVSLAAGCTAEEDSLDSPFVRKPKATPTPGVSGSIGGASPSPTPGSSATPNPATNVSSNINTDATPLPVQTLPPNTQPSPTPTPLGATSMPAFLSGTPRGLAFLTNTIAPYVLRASDVVGLDQNQQIGPTYSSTIDQPVGLAADGAQSLWVLSADHVDRLTYDFGSLSRDSSAAVTSGAAIAASASEAWIPTGNGMVKKVSSTGAVSTYTGYPALSTIALDATYAWVAGAGSTVYRIRRTDGASTSVTVGGTPAALAVDAHGSVWVAHQGSAGATRIASNLATIPVTLDAPARVVAVDANRVWFSMSSSLAYYALDGQKQGNVSLPLSPFALAIDAYHRVWAMASTGEYVTVWGN